MRDNGDVAVRVRLLGPFSVVSGGRAAGPWPRPSARRLCQLVLVSPGRRVSRDLACEELFPDLDPRAAARSVSKALSMARAALAALGPDRDARPARGRPDPHLGEPGRRGRRGRTRAGLRAALALGPGHERDDLLATALAGTASCSPTSRTPTGRCARGSGWRRCARRRGWPWPGTGPGAQGQARPEAVLAAWAACVEHDPASEEAAAALVRAYFAAGHRDLAVRAYERCRAALGELGVGMSPWLEEVYATPPSSCLASRSALSRSGDRRTGRRRPAGGAADGERAVRRGGPGGPAGPGGACGTWSAAAWAR